MRGEAASEMDGPDGGQAAPEMREPDGVDPSTWARAVEDHLGPVYRYVRARVPGERADDIVQDVFVAATRNRRQFDARRGSFAQWLYGIASRKVADHYRQSDQRAHLGVAAGSLTDERTRIEAALVCEAALPDEVCVRSEFCRLVQAAFSVLEPRQQQGLRARYYDGLSLEQVAATLGLTPAAANSLLYRARERLRTTLRALLGSDDSLKE